MEDKIGLVKAVDTAKIAFICNVKEHLF